MKVSYNALEVKQTEQKNKDVFVKKLGGRIRDARVEMRVCPVCGSENVIMCGVHNDTDFCMSEYYLDGYCRDCESKFRSDALFFRCTDSYDKERGEFKRNEDYVSNLRYMKTLWAFFTVLLIVVIIVGVALMMNSGAFAEEVEEYSVHRFDGVVALWGGFFSIVFGVLGSLFTVRGFGKSSAEIKDSLEYYKRLDESKAQLEKDNIPLFMRGVSDEVDSILNYLNEGSDWWLSDVKE